MKTDQEVIETAKESYSIADLLRRLGLKFTGGNHKTYKNRVKELGAVLKERPQGFFNYSKGPKRRLEEYLVKGGPKIGTSDLRRRLVKSGLKRHQCEFCGIREWQNKPINLHLD